MATKKTTKRPAAKKAPSGASRVKASANGGLLAVKPRSFRRSAPEPFFTFKFSVQTLYWTILSVIVLGLGLWVVYINDRVQAIYDQIDITNSATNSIQIKAQKH